MIYDAPPEDPSEIVSKHRDILIWTLEENPLEKDYNDMNCLEIAEKNHKKIFMRVTISKFRRFCRDRHLNVPETVIRIKDFRIVFNSLLPSFSVIKKQVAQMRDEPCVQIPEAFYSEETERLLLNVPENRNDIPYTQKISSFFSEIPSRYINRSEDDSRTITSGPKFVTNSKPLPIESTKVIPCVKSKSQSILVARYCSKSDRVSIMNANSECLKTPMKCPRPISFPTPPSTFTLQPAAPLLKRRSLNFDAANIQIRPERPCCSQDISFNTHIKPSQAIRENIIRNEMLHSPQRVNMNSGSSLLSKPGGKAKSKRP